MAQELRLLLIEDSPTDAELEIRELKRAGLRIVHRVVDTEDAYREALRDFRADVILSDFSMPHFDGMLALALAHELVPDVPFIFVSGTIGEEYAIRALKSGATDYVLKDNLVRLPAAVERAVQEAAERAARRKTERELEETRSRLDTIVSSLPDVVWSYSLRERRLLYVSPAATMVFHTPLPSLYESPTVWMQLIHPEDRRRVERDRRASLRSRRLDSTYRVVLPGGEVRWMHDRGTVVTDENGELLRIDGLARDVTELKLQEDRIRRLSRIQSVLSGINSAIVRIRDRQQLFDEACRIASEEGKFEMTWIGTIDSDKQEVRPVAWTGFSAETANAVSWASISAAGGTLSEAITTRRPSVRNDIGSELSSGRLRQEAVARGCLSTVCMPLEVEGRVAALMVLFAKGLGFFVAEELALLGEVAANISFALESIAQQERIERLSRIRSVLGEMNAAIVRIRDRQQLFEEACRIALNRGKFAMTWIGMLDDAAQAVRPVAKAGREEGYLERQNLSIDPNITTNLALAVEAIARGAPVICNDIATDGRMRPWRTAALERGFRSNVMLPLMLEQRAVGVFALYSPEPGFFDEEEMKLLVELAGDIGFALQTIEKQEKLDYLSYYDPLTGLSNRTLFHDRVNHALQAQRESGGKLALLFLDLHRFGIINESYGRQAGDALLKLVAERLAGILEGQDYLARIGANTFAAVLREVKHEAGIAHTLEQGILDALKRPFEIGGQEIRTAAHAGIALFPADGDDAETLFRNAEAALAKAKNSGDVYLFYAPQMNARVADQLKLENDLRDALTHEQYVLHYQPRIDLASGKIVGMEALIRWKHPVRGMISPGEFIPVLEETGMILDVGHWALRRAAFEHAAWCTKGLAPPRIAVNVSPAQLRRRDFIDHVKDALAPVKGAANRIDIEITESMLMEDVTGSIDKLRALQSSGIRVALDDFGTGYSSLSYLGRLPINSLKIDRSFVQQMSKSPEQMAIVSTVITLARALNLKVVAEGVEIEEQANLLRLLRCDEAQGYLFGWPVPPEEMEPLIS